MWHWTVAQFLCSLVKLAETGNRSFWWKSNAKVLCYKKIVFCYIIWSIVKVGHIAFPPFINSDLCPKNTNLSLVLKDGCYFNVKQLPSLATFQGIRKKELQWNSGLTVDPVTNVNAEEGRGDQWSSWQEEEGDTKVSRFRQCSELENDRQGWDRSCLSASVLCLAGLAAGFPEERWHLSLFSPTHLSPPGQGGYVRCSQGSAVLE